jgi:hypothetical protein
MNPVSRYASFGTTAIRLTTRRAEQLPLLFGFSAEQLKACLLSSLPLLVTGAVMSGSSELRFSPLSPNILRKVERK